jgi:hypothetical protein
MRPFLFLLPLAALLGGCAYEGVVVAKDSQPHPMYLSQGIEGKYTFIVEDKSGARHRQMVTPEVFERYAIGQYFNDQETGPSGTLDDGKLMKSETDAMTARRSTAKSSVLVARKTTPAKAAKTTVAAKSAKAKPRLAAKASKKRQSIAAKRKRSKPAKSLVTVAYVAPAPAAAPAPVAPIVTVPAPFDAGHGVVTVARCR